MPINITSNYSNPQFAIMQKFQNTYKQNNIAEKAVVQKSEPIINRNIADIRDINSNDIRDYLSVDEKRTLKEVFGDFNVDKNIVPGYNGVKYSEFLKGNQIDVKL
jgi:hypothetical protein